MTPEEVERAFLAWHGKSGDIHDWYKAPNREAFTAGMVAAYRDAEKTLARDAEYYTRGAHDCFKACEGRMKDKADALEPREGEGPE
jgi:hypothetical protein